MLIVIQNAHDLHGQTVGGLAAYDPLRTPKLILPVMPNRQGSVKNGQYVGP